MSARSWIRKLFARTPRTARKDLGRFRFRPHLEMLEDRMAPAAGLAIATSLDNAHLRLHFDVQLARTATNPANYAIPGLTIEKAALQASRRDIVLTTSPQDDIAYTVTASNVVARNGTPLSGTLTGSFEGTPDPTLLLVTPLSSTGLLLHFNTVLSSTQARLPASYLIDGLTVKKARLLHNGTDVVLTTLPQEEAPYSIELVNLRTRVGNLPVGTGEIDTFYGYPGDQTPPRVTGATSTGNTRVLVSFSEPMSDSAVDPLNYSIVQTSGTGGAGVALVKDARFLNGDHSTVELTTYSQNDLNFTVTVVNVTDQAGYPLAPAVLAGGQRIDSGRATFQGTPPKGDEIVDTDGDGLPDHVEQRGWQVTIKLTGGGTRSWWVTSDPTLADTDGEGFNDAVENQLDIDPRNPDTDGDLLTDWQEYTEVFSDHLNQDSDGDGVDDGTEFLGVKSSPVFADTDGDQIPDGVEIPLGGPRNILVADLPRPEISVGGVNLALDVRFTETNNHQTRDLGTESFSTTLENASTDTTTTQNTANIEGYFKYTSGEGEQGFVSLGEGGLTAGYTYNYTHDSADASRQQYEKSLQTENEVTQGFTAERNVVGATMQVAVNLHNLSDLAYRVKNLQITALVQDPLDHGRLTPVATLVPDHEPEEGFTLGPLVADRGPILFSNDTIIPSLVESLMANSTGLIFRISNYDVVNEDGRNFAFTSQEVVERTGAVLIDFGGANQLLAQVNGEAFDQTNPPPQVESYRVATATGRAIADTNGDGRIDTGPARELFDAQGNSLGIDADGDGTVTAADASFVPDRRVTFDLKGNLVGINFHQALASIGLVRYDEAATPTANLTQEQIHNSYSTRKVGNLERIYRIREIANDAVNQRYWELIGKLGIVQAADLDHVVLTSDSPISLNFVQDLDGDGLPADVEYFLRTSDSPVPLFDLTNGAVPFSTNAESDLVNVGPAIFAPGTPVRVSFDGGGLMTGTDYFLSPIAAPLYFFYTSKATALAGGPTGRVDITATVVATLVPGVAVGRDTDRDGLDDRFEALVGWKVTTPQRTYQVYSSPNRADSNFDAPKPGVDSDGDGVEDRLEYDGSDLGAAPAGWDDRNNNGLRDPGEVFQLATGDLVLDPIRKDTDGDGIDDATEVIGYRITPITGGTKLVSSKPNTPFTDSDTFSDGLERQLGLDPTDSSDTDEDGDGLPDSVETAGWAVGRATVILDPSHAAVPFSTSATFDYVLFTPVPNFVPGTLVHVSATGGGLTAGTDYFVYAASISAYGFVTFHTSEADALANRNRVDLTGDITAQVIPGVRVRRVEAVSSAPYEQGSLTERTATSSTDAVDSDGDGLTDYDEYFLHSDPTSKDTDGDGIPDRVEALGYALGHQVGGKDLGIIKTDPLDADSDNDMLKDGAEAELADADFDGTPDPIDERSHWVVRVRNAVPYQAFSNPLLADADFDGVVDGVERTYGTDPNNGNTDGDGRSDGVEVKAGSNPLAVDLRVTVVARSFDVSAGSFQYALTVRTPDPSGLAGLSTAQTTVVSNSTASVPEVGTVQVAMSGAFVARVYYQYSNPAGVLVTTAAEDNLLAGQTKTYDPGLKGVPVGAHFFVWVKAVSGNDSQSSKELVYKPGNSAVAKFNSSGTTASHSTDFTGIDGISAELGQSVSFGLAEGDNFSIEGFVTNLATNQTVLLGGLRGIKAQQESASGTTTTSVRTVFTYTDVAEKFIEDFTFETTVGGSTVKLKFFYIVG